jgi:hypothetical protein
LVREIQKVEVKEKIKVGKGNTEGGGEGEG